MKRLSDFIVSARGFTLMGIFASALLVACDNGGSSGPIEIYGDESSSSVESESSSSLVSSSSLASSSSRVKSSSSSVGKHSSSSSVTPKSSSSEDLVVSNGSMVDTRDGRIYNVVTIGKQTWMAKNLSYETENSFCFKDSDENCAKYGRLYTWAAAVGKSESECGTGQACDLPRKGVQGVCPDGWHLPKSEEFQNLISAVGGVDVAEKVLKAKTGWVNNGSDIYGFSGLQAGFRNIAGGYIAENAYFWTASEDGSREGRDILLNENDADGLFGSNDKSLGFSVRCVQDSKDSVGIEDWSWTVPKAERLNPKVAYDSIKDSRDGRVYKTVRIGKQTWMAENLNYADSAGTPSLKGNNWCVDNDTANCNVAGRLYTWAAALEVCPDGWHLPAAGEWSSLIDAIGNAKTSGGLLKSTTGWGNGGHGVNGTDDYGFSALPAGIWRGTGEKFYNDGFGALFWSSTEDGEFGAYALSLWDESNLADLDYFIKDLGASVRCIKN